jgi:hypothetical protein
MTFIAAAITDWDETHKDCLQLTEGLGATLASDGVISCQGQGEVRSPSAFPISGSHGSSIALIAGTAEEPGKQVSTALSKPFRVRYLKPPLQPLSLWSQKITKLVAWAAGHWHARCPFFSAVPDSIIIKVLVQRLEKQDCVQKGWVLHGFPRDLDQAQMLKKVGFSPNRWAAPWEPQPQPCLGLPPFGAQLTASSL